MLKYVWIVALAVFLSGCSIQNSLETKSTDSEIIDSSSRQGDTTISGSLSKSGSKYFIQKADGQSQEVESYSYELSEFEGKQIEVTGQFSGDTLFAGNIKVVVPEEEK